MNHIHTIALSDVGPLKDVKFDIPLGVSTIYGLNDSTGKASKNSNFVGKSVLVSSPYELFYEDPVVGTKQDRLKHGKRAVSFTRYDGKKVVVQRVSRGRTNKLIIKVDGEVKKYRTPTIAKDALSRLWPLSQIDYSLYHIDSRVPHPLVAGSSAERKAFLTKFFHLHLIDQERKLYAAALTRTNKTKAAFQELRAAYNKGRDDILDEETERRYRLKAKRLRQSLADIQEQFTQTQETRRILAFMRASKEQVAKLQHIIGDDLTEDRYEQRLKDNQWELKDALDKLENARQWDAYKKQNESYIAQWNALPKKARILIKNKGLEAARRLVDRAKTANIGALSAVRDLEGRVEELTDKVERLRSRVVKSKIAKPEGDVEDLKTAMRAYKHQLEHAEKFKRGKCETCGQTVSVKDPELLRRRVSRLSAQINEHGKYELWLEDREQLRKAKADLEAIVAQLEAAKEKADKSKPYAELYDPLFKLVAKPAPFKGLKLQLEVCQRMVDEIKEAQALLHHMRPHLDTIISSQSLTKAQIREAKEAGELGRRLNEVQNQLSTIQTKLEVHNTMYDRMQDMRRRLVKMKKQVLREPAQRMLLEGFQDKKLKRMAVQALSQHLMALVNKYAADIMPEQMRFELVWDTQISILAHRKNGKVSDVRRLSGSEAFLFTLILFMAHLAFVSASKRSSVLFLDEPTAHLSPEMTQTFMRVIPALNKLIPSIVIVTPRSDEVYEGAKPFTLVKTAGVTTLHEGYPHQIKRNRNNDNRRVRSV